MTGPMDRRTSGLRLATTTFTIAHLGSILCQILGQSLCPCWILVRRLATLSPEECSQASRRMDWFERSAGLLAISTCSGCGSEGFREHYLQELSPFLFLTCLCCSTLVGSLQTDCSRGSCGSLRIVRQLCPAQGLLIFILV